MVGKDEKSIFIDAHAPNRETLPLIYDGELQSNDRRGNFTFGRENFKV